MISLIREMVTDKVPIDLIAGAFDTTPNAIIVQCNRFKIKRRYHLELGRFYTLKACINL